MLRARRSPYLSPVLFHQAKDLVSKIDKYNIKHKGEKYKYKLHPVNVKTSSRDSTILPLCVGYSFLVSNGRIFTHVLVSDSIVGYKFGEFCNTRRRYYYKIKKKKKKKTK
jgi:small subunit ribosomal protein S19